MLSACAADGGEIMVIDYPTSMARQSPHRRARPRAQPCSTILLAPIGTVVTSRGGLMPKRSTRRMVGLRATRAGSTGIATALRARACREHLEEHPCRYECKASVPPRGSDLFFVITLPMLLLSFRKQSSNLL